MNYTAFKTKIRKKFGSLQRYMELTGVTQKDLDQSFDTAGKGNPRRVRSLLSKANKVKETTMPEKDITPELLEKIRVAIYTKHRSQSEFCDSHKAFTNTWLSALLNGKFPRISKKVNKLIKTLKIENEE